MKAKKCCDIIRRLFPGRAGAAEYSQRVDDICWYAQSVAFVGVLPDESSELIHRLDENLYGGGIPTHISVREIIESLLPNESFFEAVKKMIIDRIDELNKFEGNDVGLFSRVQPEDMMSFKRGLKERCDEVSSQSDPGIVLHISEIEDVLRVSRNERIKFLSLLLALCERNEYHIVTALFCRIPLPWVEWDSDMPSEMTVASRLITTTSVIRRYQIGELEKLVPSLPTNVVEEIRASVLRKADEI